MASRQEYEIISLSSGSEFKKKKKKKPNVLKSKTARN